MSKTAKTTPANTNRKTTRKAAHQTSGKKAARQPRVAAEGVATPKPETSKPIKATAHDDMFAFGAPFLPGAKQGMADLAEKFQDHARETGSLMQERMTATAAHMQTLQDDMVAGMHEEAEAMVNFGQDMMAAQTAADMFDLQRQFFAQMIDGRITRLRTAAEATTTLGRESIDKARAHQEETMALVGETPPMGANLQALMAPFTKA
ncbi:MAG: hypothetical protein AAGL18_00490 [Pseudomonadota bacterium]